MMLGNVMKGKTGVPKSSDSDQLKAGIKCEQEEHGAWATPAQVKKIAQDHLREIDDYYDRLEEMEKEAEEGEEENTNA